MNDSNDDPKKFRLALCLMDEHGEIAAATNTGLIVREDVEDAVRKYNGADLRPDIALVFCEEMTALFTARKLGPMITLNLLSKLWDDPTLKDRADLSELGKYEACFLTANLRWRLTYHESSETNRYHGVVWHTRGGDGPAVEVATTALLPNKDEVFKQVMLGLSAMVKEEASLGFVDPAPKEM